MTEIVGVVGFGLIGQSWAKLFAKSGYEVRIFDVRADLEELVQGINASLDEGCQQIKSGDLAFISKQSVLVQESGPENEDAKRVLFADLAEVCGENTILATSSSGISASRITGPLSEKAQRLTIVGHPFNPPEIFPLVEVVPSAKTDPQVVERALEFYRSIDKSPVLIKKERPGFVANRIQKVVIEEAVQLVRDEVISPADFDELMKNSLGLRWAAVGPFEALHQASGSGIRGFFEHIGPSFDQMNSPGIRLCSEDAQVVYGKVHECLGEKATPESIEKRNALLNELSAVRKSQNN